MISVPLITLTTKEAIFILKCYSSSKRGQYHQKHNLPNEDYVITHCQNDLTVAVVTDGAGGKKAGDTAAKIVTLAILNWLKSTFEDQYYCDGETVRRRAVQVIINGLRPYAQKMAIPEQELACTLMVAAMDSTGRCLCLHMGDGTIFRQREAHTEYQADIISPAENGVIPNSTYLTMCCNMANHIRYYRWKDPTIKKVILLTDGASEHILNASTVKQWMIEAPCPLTGESLNNYLIQQSPLDDYTCAILSKT